ncbi:uncharacterized protein PODANS_4_3514 [Podospora anserina S mat+]|uniref:Podospora anserina S mat+ genomic DNA chromosome 4, supercontig 4 n=1 Tax=Podospora anserina (strain S / ATCC MYA-4624 / DSM 980 / FGSC 10383) TaxID=515849 RepID=B2AQQ1_PODAN|nr:uncharacterized protein PODANS_4_3514 [Podospora anserina S mat+]CAP66478.1 unnamed protein product [Podospora anserina S mat+]CDP28207.1 Putative protein of unknown function [Podospora anserina S mat+]
MQLLSLLALGLSTTPCLAAVAAPAEAARLPASEVIRNLELLTRSTRDLIPAARDLSTRAAVQFRDNERGPFATVVDGLEDLASTATSDRNSIIDEDRRGREPTYIGRDARNIDKAISDLFDRAKELSERIGDESRFGRLFSNVGSKVGRGLERWGDAVYELAKTIDDRVDGGLETGTWREVLRVTGTIDKVVNDYTSGRVRLSSILRDIGRPGDRAGGISIDLGLRPIGLRLGAGRV